MRLNAAALAAVGSLAACGGAAAAPSSSGATVQPAPRVPFEVQTGSIDAAIAASHRTDEQRARDRYRHPRQTLEHFGLRPDMTVVELWPEGGWYTAILAPVVRDQGRLIAATMDPEDDTFRGRLAREFREQILPGAPEVYDRVELAVLFPGHYDIAPEGSADLVLTFRSAHNWIRWGGYERDVFAAIARALKPGGALGIVQHRAPEGSDPQVWATRGYVPEAYVIELAEQAGLTLESRPELNANPADEKAYPNGVWSLPPTLRGADEDRERFLAIGESDRMTLLFRKPAK